jgi:YHS domain-containing protein
MKVKHFVTLAAITIVGAALTPFAIAQTQKADPSIASSSSLKVCAGKSNPCASKPNPCASKPNPCASKPNPCASKPNPCASKPNPCASKAVRSPDIYAKNGVAIRGADPVAYFTQGRAVIGNAKYEHQWKGAIWRFSSDQNRRLFAQNPGRYAPQYGGYCAQAVSEGNLAKTDPEAWKIVNGKLYLNYDKTVQAQWLQDVPGHIAKADRNWDSVLNQKFHE